LKNVIKNTGLLGRWQVLQERPKVICDVAHNKEGLSFTMKQIQQESFSHLHMVVGFVKDKNLDSLISLFPKNATYYFCKPEIQRGLDANSLRESFVQKGLKGKAYKSVARAFEKAKKAAYENDVIYVGGSTFVVAEVI
jgi:dihydrofolate synthase/folylpolyglutamate synthase